MKTNHHDGFSTRFFTLLMWSVTPASYQIHPLVSLSIASIHLGPIWVVFHLISGIFSQTSTSQEKKNCASRPRCSASAGQWVETIEELGDYSSKQREYQNDAVT